MPYQVPGPRGSPRRAGSAAAPGSPSARARRRTAPPAAPPGSPCAGLHRHDDRPGAPPADPSTTSSMRLTGACGTSCACSRCIQWASGWRAKRASSSRRSASYSAMRRSRGLKRGSIASSGASQRRDQAGPELLQRGQMDRDQALVGGAQDVGLRQSRPVRGGRRLAEREEGGEGLDRKVRHGLEHRDLDLAARGRCGRAGPARRGCRRRHTGR